MTSKNNKKNVEHCRIFKLEKLLKTLRLDKVNQPKDPNNQKRIQNPVKHLRRSV